MIKRFQEKRKEGKLPSPRMAVLIPTKFPMDHNYDKLWNLTENRLQEGRVAKIFRLAILISILAGVGVAAKDLKERIPVTCYTKYLILAEYESKAPQVIHQEYRKFETEYVYKDAKAAGIIVAGREVSAGTGCHLVVDGLGKMSSYPAVGLIIEGENSSAGASSTFHLKNQSANLNFKLISEPPVEAGETNRMHFWNLDCEWEGMAPDDNCKLPSASVELRHVN